MSTRRLVVTIGTTVALALAAAPAAQADDAGSVTNSDGDVSATLSWKASTGIGVSSPRLSITRAGVTTDLNVGDVCKQCTLIEDAPAPDPGQGPYSIMHVADLDGDGEPEVVFDTFSGGAHCCTTARIYGYQPAKGTYRRTRSVLFGNSGYTLADRNGDGRPEFGSVDDAFAYAFASYASSARPPQILTYSVSAKTGKARMSDVTRRFPQVIREDAAFLLKDLRRFSKQKDPEYEIQGLVAAYVADQYLLHHGSTGIREIGHLRKLGHVQRGFQGHLLKFLRRYHYR